MKLLSIQVGRPQDRKIRDHEVRTSIFKTAISGPVRVRTLNIDGDEQSDLTVHGGPNKAVYVYPSEHYDYWKAQLPDMEFPFGAFGENLTTEGLLEDRVAIGDRLLCGSAEFIITQPRQPCYKLSVRFDRLDMVKRFHHSGRSGFYLRVLREGIIEAGDPITLIENSGDRLTIAEAVAELTR
jgi:MOSC domain-containing protein YiiM